MVASISVEVPSTSPKATLADQTRGTCRLVIIKIIKSIIVKIEVIIYSKRTHSQTTPGIEIRLMQIPPICRQTPRTGGDNSSSKIRMIQPLRRTKTEMTTEILRNSTRINFWPRELSKSRGFQIGKTFR